MAPIAGAESFTAKQQLNARDDYYCDVYNNCYERNGAWSSWGRWVALVLVVAAVVLLFFALSCVQSRRRRRMGMQPIYGTGWMAKPPPAYSQQNQFYPNQQYNGGPPPPVYGQQTGSTFTSGQGYYGNGAGGQQSGIELQQPGQAYQPQRGGDNVYEPPAGAPPGKQ